MIAAQTSCGPRAYTKNCLRLPLMHIGVFVSLSSSAWTGLIRHVMHGRAKEVRPADRLFVLCCSCHSRDGYGYPVTNHSTNVEVAVAAEVWDQASRIELITATHGSSEELEASRRGERGAVGQTNSPRMTELREQCNKAYKCPSSNIDRKVGC